MAIALRENRPIRGKEAIAERPDGTRVPFIPYPTPLRDSSGRLVGAINMLVDITEMKQAEERRQLLINELNHRVKNTLATVQSIAAQSFRNEPKGEAHDSFERRILALSKAHDVLTRENWKGACLRDIALQAMAPLHGEDGRRFRIGGPGLCLKPNKALSFAMVFHELCTNAAKYGALSNGTGCVHLHWEIRDTGAGERLYLRWEESGGPPVEAPRRRGFGSRLIERGLACQLAAQVRLDFLPGGVVCEIDAPLS